MSGKVISHRFSVARLKPALLVRDGYEFTDASTASLEALGIPMLVIDDNREAPIGQPKFLLNQNLHASSEDYLDLDAMHNDGPSVVPHP